MTTPNRLAAKRRPCGGDNRDARRLANKQRLREYRRVHRTDYPTILRSCKTRELR